MASPPKVMLFFGWVSMGAWHREDCGSFWRPEEGANSPRGVVWPLTDLNSSKYPQTG